MAEDILIVASKVKDYIKSKNCQTAAEVIEALSKKVTKLLDEACSRTKENGRVTVKGYDL
jgi:histone H3/H4